jgi:hypothetical protein
MIHLEERVDALVRCEPSNGLAPQLPQGAHPFGVAERTREIRHYRHCTPRSFARFRPSIDVHQLGHILVL